MKRRLVICVFIFLAVLLIIFRFDFLNRSPVIIIVPSKNKTNNSLKYILQWTKPYTIPFTYLGSGQERFIERKCRVNNCYVTSDREYLNNLIDFDAILFHGPEILGYNIKRPEKRSYNQKYIFVSIESPHYYSDCRYVYNNFFNWTWTFKLDSDVPFNYLTIRDIDGTIIGPAKDINWREMLPIKEEIKKKLKNKTKAAAWFVSNCKSLSKRENVVEELKRELRVYNQTIDIYGGCSDLKCEKDNISCSKIVDNDYYFYLAFENSFAPDYVTEKVLNGLLHYAVPVVFGAADYTRFMPDSIYLDIKKLGAKEVARRMNEAIENLENYYHYFRWHNHYTYEETSVIGQAPDSDSYCKLCEMLNDPLVMEKDSVYDRFDKWWNVPMNCKNLE